MPDPALTPEMLILADAYARKLGDGSVEAKLILDDLDRQSFYDTDAPLAPAAGLPIDPLQLAVYEGARTIVRRAHRMIRWSLTAPRGPAPAQQFATNEVPDGAGS